MDNYPTYSPPPADRMRLGDALSSAVAHTRRLLFNPFRFEVWISLGVIIFLEALGQQSGSSFSGRSNFSGSGGPGGPGQTTQDMARDMSEGIRRAVEYFQENMALVVGIGAAVMIILIGIFLLLTWLGSYGSLMLVRAVSTTDTRISDNWRAVRPAAWSYFMFRVFLGLAGSLVFLGLLFVAGGILVSLANRDTDELSAYIFGLLPVFLLFMVFGLTFAIILTLLRNFVAPLMWRFEVPVMEGWRIFRTVSRGNVLPIIGFILIRFLYSIGFGILGIFVCIVTCCIGMLPVIHQTIFAPYYVFDRAFSLFLLGTAGPDYAMVTEPAPPPPPYYEGPAPLLDRFPEHEPSAPPPPPVGPDEPRGDEPFRNPFERDEDRR